MMSTVLVTATSPQWGRVPEVVRRLAVRPTRRAVPLGPPYIAAMIFSVWGLSCEISARPV